MLTSQVQYRRRQANKPIEFFHLLFVTQLKEEQYCLLHHLIHGLNIPNMLILLVKICTLPVQRQELNIHTFRVLIVYFHYFTGYLL